MPNATKNRFKAGDSVKCTVRAYHEMLKDYGIPLNETTTVIAVPGDPEYDRLYYCNADKGMVIKAFPSQKCKQLTFWMYQEDFVLATEEATDA